MSIRAIAFALTLLTAALVCDAGFNSESAFADGLLGSVAIVADSVVRPGTPLTVAIVFTDTTVAVAGFNFYIEYDRGALVFDSAVLGGLTQGEWEYFTTRSGLLNPTDSGSASAYIRLLAIADAEDAQKRSPKPRSLVGPGELVKLFLYASDRSDYQNQSTYLRFIWGKCDDNSFSDKSGNKLYLSRDVRDSEGRILATGFDKYSGAKPACFVARPNRPNTAQRVFDFRSVGIVIRSGAK